MDKKIAIVTWYKNLNYGGTLQAYALQKTIEQLGLASEFVNYCPEEKRMSYKLIRFFKDLAIFFYKPKLHKSRQKIQKFVEDKLKESPPYFSYTELKDIANERYSAAICGSDQIWSNNSGVVNPLYYLTFIEENKRIAYAPSIGYNQVSKNIAEIFREYVCEIKFLSVREKKGAEIISDVCGREAKVVLDPSLLMTKEQWNEEIKHKKKVSPKREYILCYLLGKNSDYLDYARQLSEFTGYDIIALESRRLKIKGVKKIIADPFDFVELINNAKYILTDSFHGVAFSINLEKQFGVFKRFEDDDPICQNSRIYNILEKTGLQSRLITTQTPLGFFNDEVIDYNAVRPLLEAERRDSLNYLTNALSKVVNEKKS